MSRDQITSSISIAFAVAMTFATISMDAHFGSQRQNDQALTLSRQLVAQAESATLAAREKGVNEPEDWSARLLSQGAEPLLAHVSRVEGTPDSNHFDENETGYIFTKISYPEKKTGFQVSLVKSYRGNFGSHTRWASDLIVLILFLMYAGLAYSSLRWKDERDADKNRRARLQQWIHLFKPTLHEMAKTILALVKNANQVVISVARSKRGIHELRENLHSELNDLRLSTRSAKDAEKCAQLAETLLTQLMEEDFEHADLLQKCFFLIQRAGTSASATRTLIEAVESQIEPWSMDLDLIIQAHDLTDQAVQAFSNSVSHTRNQIVGQTKVVQQLKKMSL